jgi:hypothetical protein
MKRLALAMGLAFTVVSFLTGCGGGSATVTPNIVNGGITSRSFSLVESPFSRWVEPRLPSSMSGRPTANVAQTTASSITSLQYFIQSIQLCEDVTMSGSGYSGTSGCTTLYTCPDASVQDTSVYNTYTITEAMADTSADHFVDFLSTEGRAKLATASAVDAGTYNYVLLNFMRPIKIQAEFKDGSGTTQYYSKSGGTVTAGATDSAGRETEYVRPTNTTTPSAEVMTYMLNNGGVIVPLPTPFTVADEDSVILDFVFNPANFATVTGQTSCSYDASTAVADPTNCGSFDMPYAKMAPVPRKAGETTRKEVYLIDYTTGASLAKVRLELYYNSADASKGVRGIDAAVVMDSTATTSTNNIISTYRATETAGVVSLFGYNSATGAMDAASLSALTRRAAGTATIHCSFTGGPCSTLGTTVSAPYTYVGDFGVGG